MANVKPTPADQSEAVDEWRCPDCGMTVDEYDEYLRKRAEWQTAVYGEVDD